MPGQSVGLSLEAQFTHARFCEAAGKMSREQAVDSLKKLHLHLLCKEALFKQMIKQEITGELQ